MEIVIQEIDEKNVEDVDKCNDEFIIEAKLVVHTENNEFRYTTLKVPRSTKRYEKEQIDYSTYIGRSDRTAFLAYVDRSIGGQIILRKHWNNYAFIDLGVDRSFRRMGIGKTLISSAKQWAREKQFPGLLAETQDNNVPACRLYEYCGFTLQGIDKYVYKGINKHTDEIALYWYFLFEKLTNET